MTPRQPRTSSRPAQRGFSLLEILVTLFLLTMWLLASAGVQSSSLQFNKAAQLRTQAVYLATDIAERMQANMLAAVDLGYVIPETSLSEFEIVAPDADCVEAACPSATLAIFDKAEWMGRVAAALPNATVSVSTSSVAPANPITYTILISWRDRRTDRVYAAVGTSETFSYTATKTLFRPPS